MHNFDFDNIKDNIASINEELKETMLAKEKEKAIINAVPINDEIKKIIQINNEQNEILKSQLNDIKKYIENEKIKKKKDDLKSLIFNIVTIVIAVASLIVSIVVAIINN